MEMEREVRGMRTTNMFVFLFFFFLVSFTYDPKTNGRSCSDKQGFWRA